MHAYVCHRVHGLCSLSLSLSLSFGGNNGTLTWSRALHRAAAKGLKNVTILLLDSGANPTAMDNKGRRPLHVAASSGHIDICEVLIDRGNYRLYNLEEEVREGRKLRQEGE